MNEPKRRGRPPAQPVTLDDTPITGSRITDEQVIELTLSKGLTIDRAQHLVTVSQEDRDKDWDWFVAKYIGG
jgi:hypothetical protein